MKKIRIKLSLLIFLIFPQLLYAAENKEQNKDDYITTVPIIKEPEDVDLTPKEEKQRFSNFISNIKRKLEKEFLCKGQLYKLNVKNRNDLEPLMKTLETTFDKIEKKVELIEEGYIDQIQQKTDTIEKMQFKGVQLIDDYRLNFKSAVHDLTLDINISINSIRETNNQTLKKFKEFQDKYNEKLKEIENKQKQNLEETKNKYIKKFKEFQDKYNEKLKEIENEYKLNNLNFSKYNNGIEELENKYKKNLEEIKNEQKQDIQNIGNKYILDNKNSLKKGLKESLKGQDILLDIKEKSVNNDPIDKVFTKLQKDRIQSPNKNNWVPGLILALPLVTIIIVQYIQLKVNQKKGGQLKPEADLKLTQKAKTK